MAYYAKVIVSGSPITKSNFKLHNSQGRAILPYNSGHYNDRYAIYEQEIAYNARSQNPDIILNFTSLAPYSLACSSLLEPIVFPRIIAAAEAKPKHTTVASCLITWAMEFAAAAWLPNWPIIAALAEVPSPHINSLIVTGIENLKKSFNSKWLALNRYFILNFIVWLYLWAYTKVISSSTILAITVARADPFIPIAGIPNLPNIKI